jgi:hypothetical protein
MLRKRHFVPPRHRTKVEVNPTVGRVNDAFMGGVGIGAVGFVMLALTRGPELVAQEPPECPDRRR